MDPRLLSTSDRLRVGWVPREQKMLKGHLPRVIHHQVYQYTKIVPLRSRVAGIHIIRKPGVLAVTLHQKQYRGTSLIRKRFPLGPYGRPIPRAL